jgi:hypothetical protein
MDTFPNQPLLGVTSLKRKAQDDQDDEMSLFRRVRIKTSIMIPTERSRAQSPVTEYESPRSRSQEGDDMSVVTKSSKSSEGNSKSGSGSLSGSVGQEKWKPKAKAWQAPIYAGMLPLSNISLFFF